jgi:integrase
MRTPKPFYRSFNDTWYVQLGKRQIPLAKGKANEREAYRRYYDVMAEQPTGAMPGPLPKAKVAVVCDQFLDWCQKHNAPRTYDWYREFLQDFCEHCGKMAVSDLKPFHVTKWLDLHPGWKGSRRGAIIAVKRAFTWAADEGLIEANPVKKLRKPPPTSRDRILTPEERWRIAANYRAGDPFRDFLFALQETGARPGEVAAVTAAHVDLRGGVWVFRKHKTAKRTKAPKPRVVILTPAMVVLTRELVARYPEGPLFRNADGRPWTRNAIRCRFRRLREKLGLGGNLVAYLYRHTFTTDALANGAGLAEVCELLGHTTTATVMRHYAHLQEKREHLRKAAVKAAGDSVGG